MSKTKKIMLTVIILIVTCCVTAVCSIKLYLHFAPTPQEKSIIAIVGEENLKDVESATYKFERTYFNTDGTTGEIGSGRSDITWDGWK